MTGEPSHVRFYRSGNPNPFVVGQNYKMVSINTSLQVDVTGQCCSEPGTKQAAAPEVRLTLRWALRYRKAASNHRPVLIGQKRHHIDDSSHVDTGSAGDSVHMDRTMWSRSRIAVTRAVDRDRVKSTAESSQVQRWLRERSRSLGF